MFTLKIFWHFVNEALFQKRTPTFSLSFLWYRLSAVKSYDEKRLVLSKNQLCSNFKRSKSWLISWQKHNLKHGHGIDKRPAFKVWRAGKAEWNIIGLCQRSSESRRKWSRVFGEFSFKPYKVKSKFSPETNQRNELQTNLPIPAHKWTCDQEIHEVHGYTRFL